MSTEAKLIVAAVAVVVLATLVFTAVLLVRLVRAKRHLRQAGVPVGNKLAFWGALLYTISPIDLLPDPILIDDIGVLLVALHSLRAAAEAAAGRGGQPLKAGLPPVEHAGQRR
ncbi:YkvA family protein [Streptomyces sp. H27-C3]|uniref:YkvA family protein n=1 Tax=Streptomyces sp. H27-C3 TaxID=3046305 RepID=UPI0024B88513|nr:YkvA family protein [Streptomyces sp. H27-C3]MDJ0462646.1 YkvA family protein [Streptomyces sp. H27-C3]